MNKTIYLFILLLLYSYMAIAQGGPGNVPTPVTSGQDLKAQPTQNYIRTYKYKVANSPSLTDPSEVNVDITYFDGLGRSSQVVSVMASPTGKDVITPIAYDNYGRQEKKYLPFAKSATGNDGEYTTLTDAISEQKIFLGGIYGSTDKNYGYSETDFDDSPLNRVIRESSPGAAWRMDGGHEVEYSYTTNTSTVVGYRYTGDDFDDYEPVEYAARKLYITNKTDENGNTVKEYTDFEGKVIQEVNAAGKKTRYCYDDFGLLRCVIQPKGTSPSTTEFCFYYKYDERKRMTDKKIPGADWVYMIYDGRDRLVATSDGNSRNNSGHTYPKWYYSKYDDLNRVIEKGYYRTTKSRQELIGSYTLMMYPFVYHYKQQTFLYDNYPTDTEYNDIGFVPNALATSDELYDNPTGLLTVVKLSAINEYSSNNNPFYKLYFYDKFGRTIQYVEAGDNKIQRTSYDHNFAGEVIHERVVTYNGSTNTFDTWYDYDHRGRLLKTRMKIDNGLETIVSANKYDEAGQLSKKGIHSQNNGSFLQRSDYKYNIRGWLTQIDDPDNFDTGDVFGLKLFYNSTPTGGTACYNGNISAVKWNTNDSSNYQYLYNYNNVDRLVAANFSGDGYNSNSYDCSYSYDDNGNFVTIRRKGFIGSDIDVLRFSYRDNGNKIVKVADFVGGHSSVDDYAGSNSIFQYDDNGNLIYEPNKGSSGVALEYNHLNLPDEVDFGLDNKIHYYYRADGAKVKQRVESGSSVIETEYVGPLVYEVVGSTRSLKYIITPEGLAYNNNNTYLYEYHIKDHLGNVRVVLAQDGVIKQTTDYYPYGMKITPLCTSNSDNPYLYNGKEMQNELGLDWYDYGARFYDPALGRWHSVDPMAEDYYSHSPYHFSGNNPIRLLDLNGMNYGDFYNENGTWLGSDGIDDDKVYNADAVTLNDQGAVTKAENAKELSISHTEFQKQAATVYGESSAYKMNSVTSDLKKEMFSIASVHQSNSLAYGANSDKAKEYLNLSPGEINNSKFKTTANAAVINAVTGGVDYSYGATMWDGREQSLFSATDNRSSNGKWELHMNTMGWNISDSHYNTWNTNVGAGFKAPQQKASPANFGNYNNKGMMRLQSTAVYGETIFWRIK